MIFSVYRSEVEEGFESTRSKGSPCVVHGREWSPMFGGNTALFTDCRCCKPSAKGKHSLAHLSHSYEVPGSEERGQRSDAESE